MSYEAEMLVGFGMPTRKEVEQILLKVLFKHGGVIREFGSGEKIVDEIANEFGLNEKQKTAALETIYRKENRVKRSLLWHRLLFRAADSLAKQKLVSRPTSTLQLTQKREWMLTESGFDEVLNLLNIPNSQKDFFPVKSYEVQKIVKKLTEAPRAENYNPFDQGKKIVKVTRESILRTRGFRQAVIEAYNYKCAFCGMKICTPDTLSWEVEAVHIVSHNLMGKDDVCNGLALCRLHHWAFDVGWVTLYDDFKIQVSARVNSIPSDFGKMGNYDFIRVLSNKSSKIFLPKSTEIYPHPNSIRWHRENIFYHKLNAL